MAHLRDNVAYVVNAKYVFTVVFADHGTMYR